MTLGGTFQKEIRDTFGETEKEASHLILSILFSFLLYTLSTLTILYSLRSTRSDYYLKTCAQKKCVTCNGTEGVLFSQNECGKKSVSLILGRKKYSFRPIIDVTLSFLVCTTKDVTFSFLKKVLSHMNIKIIFSLFI